jgi:hypothetical protein
MSSLTADRLYGLLPAIYRLRDVDEDEPLRALLAALAEGFAALEENIEQLYDDQFIETCADWVAPYIGDLIGYRPLHGVAPKIASPRAEVANTIAFRRRKGTALMLEELAQDVTDWPAHAVEFFEQLATTQYMNHIRPHARATADLRRSTALFRQGPFNSLAHTAEMRRPESGAGRYNIPNIGIFLWRLLSLRLSAVPLTPDPGDTSGRKFRVNPLGADLQLFRRPQSEDDISHLTEPINVPEPLSVRLMAVAVRAAKEKPPADAARDDDYGDGESIFLQRPGNPPTPVSVDEVVIADLRDILDAGGNVVAWNHQDGIPDGKIAVDPERGRVLLDAAGNAPLLATFHYGSIRAIGGGEYERTPLGEELMNQRTIGNGAALQPELDAAAAGGRLLIGDSLTYAQTPTPTFKVNDMATADHPGITVVVAARNSARPLIVAAGDVTLQVGARGRLILDGLVFAGSPLRLATAADVEPRELVLRDCTLVPGHALNPDGSAVSPGAVSLIVEHPFAKVTLERCITGPLHVAAGDTEVTLTDCIVDAGAPENIAYAADAAGGPGAELTISDVSSEATQPATTFMAGSTVIGKVHTKLLRLASNSIFFARLGPAPGETWIAPLIAQRRQEGCVRFCYVPPGSITPRRFRCVPDENHPAAQPRFTSLRYGQPGYGQLRRGTSKSIREGASDGNEMGVTHRHAQAQRETNLRIRLEEYLRFGLHAGIFFAT